MSFSKIATIPNMISLARLPLALFFLQNHPLYRAIAILLAMLSDGLDGYLARRYRSTSTIGSLLDPLMDKFFVLFCLGVFINEDKLTLWEAAAFICRDFSVLFFGITLALKGYLSTYQFRSIWCGKVTTFLQFSTLFALTLDVAIPSFAYAVFIALGLFALAELYLSGIRGSAKG